MGAYSSNIMGGKKKKSAAVAAAPVPPAVVGNVPAAANGVATDPSSGKKPAQKPAKPVKENKPKGDDDNTCSVCYDTFESGKLTRH